MNKIIIINGNGGVGKDTFVNFCLNYIYNYSKDKFNNYFDDKYTQLDVINKCNIDSIYHIKQIAYECGWNGSKTEKNRKFLSDLKNLLTQWNDFSFKTTCNDIRNRLFCYLNATSMYLINNSLIFVHVREPQEIKRYVEKFNTDNNCYTLLIKNPSIPFIYSNSADANIEKYHYNFIVNNNDTLISLQNVAFQFCEDILFKDINKFVYDCQDYKNENKGE